MQSNGRKIKLCFISYLAYPLFNKNVNAVFGGAEIDLYNLALKFAGSSRYDVTFIVGDYGQRDEEIHQNIRVRKIKYIGSRYSKMYHKTARKLLLWKELLKNDSDIFITEASSEMLGWLAIISKKLKGKKIIFRLAHDLDTDMSHWKKVSKRHYLLYNIGLNSSNFIVSQTEIQRKLLHERLNIDSTVIKNGFFIEDNIDFNQKGYILWVARSEEWKRPELYIELARRLPEQKFVMIMPGLNEVKLKVKESIKELDNVELIDYVPFTDVQKYYDGARLFVNTSHYEGFPNAFVQACLSKTPILSFNVNPDGFIDKYRLGMCCNDSIYRAIDFIRRLDDLKIRFYGENAFRYVKKNHNIDRCLVQYEEIINKLMESAS